MNKKKKTKTGVEIKSTFGAPSKKAPVWWLAIIEKKSVRILSYSLSNRNLSSVFFSKLPNYRDAVSREIRDSAGRNQASFSWARGGHQTSHPRHSYSSKYSPDEKASGHLFLKAAHFLKEEGKKGHYQALALIGHAHSLGEFRHLLDRKTQHKITIQSTSFANYGSEKSRKKQLLALFPEKPEKPLRWLPNQNLRKG